MDLKDLYRDIIVDHNRHPRNFREIADADRRADGFNPLCGDKLTVFVSSMATASATCRSGQRLRDLGRVRFPADRERQGPTLPEAEALFQQMHQLLTQEDAVVDLPRLGKLGALSGVREFPARVKCASLCWHTLDAALHQQEQISTE